MNANNDSDRTALNNALSTIGDAYAMEQVPCDPGETAFKITKHGSDLSVYVIVFHDPDYIEFITFDGDETVSQTYLYRGRESTGKYADIIRNCF